MQRSTTTLTPAKSNKGKLDVLVAARANSARANLQSHPCFQSSLFSDKDRPAGSIKLWKERIFVVVVVVVKLYLFVSCFY